MPAITGKDILCAKHPWNLWQALAARVMRTSLFKHPLWLGCLAWAGVLVAGWFFIRPLPLAGTRPSVGFTTLYTSSRLVLEHTSLANLYDDAWFNTQVRRFTPTVSEIYRPNTPAAALLALPISWLDYRQARMLWTGLSLLTLVAIWGWICGYLGLSGFWIPGSIFYFLIFEPFSTNLWYGQIYIFILALFLLAWQGLRQGKARWSGIALGLLLGFKSAGVFLGFIPLQRKNWGVIGWGIGTIAVICLGSVLWLGWKPWQAYFNYCRHFAGLVNRPEQVVTSYQTIPSLVYHLTRYDARWNPSPWFHAPLTGQVLAMLACLAILGISLYWLFKNKPADPSPAAAILTLAQLMVSPWSLGYHYPLFILPLVIVVSAFRQHGARGLHWLALGLGAALVALPFHYYPAPGLQAQAWALLAYPKLYGALILWLLCMRAKWEGFRGLGE